MLVDIEDESVEKIITTELKGSLERADVGLSKKGVKALLWVLKWYSTHDDWEEYKESSDYNYIKKVFKL